jgi:hypothetical protein
MTPKRKPKRICFVAAPIGEEGSEIRKRSDRVLQIIDRAVKGRGFSALRADKITGAGLISRQVIQYLLDAPLVIADLTGANPNVYYELALRHAVGKPYIQLIAKGEQPPFDVRDVRTLHIDHNEPFLAEELLAATVLEVDKPDFAVENPVTAVRRLA